jgi:hypothetical protein
MAHGFFDLHRRAPVRPIGLLHQPNDVLQPYAVSAFDDSVLHGFPPLFRHVLE